MSEANHLLRLAFESRIANAGVSISSAEARTLVYVFDGEGSRLRDIALRMGVEPMTVGGHIDRLEQEGLVVRVRDSADRRAKNVFVTPEAVDIVDCVAGIAKALCEDCLAGVGEGDRAVFSRVLATVRENLRAQALKSGHSKAASP